MNMYRLAITLAVSVALALAAAAVAALPTTGPFAGKTSLHSINGFADLVTFTSGGGGRVLRKFTFGTLGCFGHGSYPVGVDPYGDATNTALVKPITVNANGTFSISAKPTLADPQGIVTTAVIQGSFTNAKSVSGTITISQTDNGDTCGPSKMKFTAVSGTPESLGLND
jgi:hypothetical protein